MEISSGTAKGKLPQGWALGCLGFYKATKHTLPINSMLVQEYMQILHNIYLTFTFQDFQTMHFQIYID